jgi:hypothetical protein
MQVAAAWCGDTQTKDWQREPSWTSLVLSSADALVVAAAAHAADIGTATGTATTTCAGAAIAVTIAHGRCAVAAERLSWLGSAKVVAAEPSRPPSARSAPSLCRSAPFLSCRPSVRTRQQHRANVHLAQQLALGRSQQ